MDVRRFGMVLAALGAAAIGHAQEKLPPGRGPQGQGPVRVADLDFGTHWFGPELRQEDLVGKVVLVELWGS